MSPVTAPPTTPPAGANTQENCPRAGVVKAISIVAGIIRGAGAIEVVTKCRTDNTDRTGYTKGERIVLNVEWRTIEELFENGFSENLNFVWFPAPRLY